MEELRRGLDDAHVKIKFGKEARIGNNDASSIQVEIDIIVTDPPYGFNTVEDASELMTVYQKFLNESIAKLSNGGHLVLCLPDKSYVGKSFPFFTVPELVVAQVLAVAERNGRVAYIEAQSLPTPRSFFAPPYYWKSARALKRSILHFRFVKKEHMRV